jgi:xylulokinase
MKNWMGIDVGTSGVKALIVNDDGQPVARGSAGYRGHGSDGTHEQDASEYLDAVRRAIRECGITPDGIGIVGQTPSLVLADEEARAVRRVVTWRDTRATDEADELRGLGDSIELFGVDNQWDVSQLPAKLLWLARNDAAALSAARWMLQPKDLVGFALTGTAATDPWSSKGLCSIETRRAVEPVFAAAGADPGTLPPLRSPWELLGDTTTAIDALELPTGVPVAVGWTDALGGMLAVGAVTHPRSFVLTGTSDIVGTSTTGREASIGGLYQVPQSVSPSTIDYGPTQSSGASLVWLAQVTGRDVSELVDLASRARDTGGTFVPYLRGERAPLWNSAVRARLTGLSDDDGLGELALAIMRGVSFSNRHVLETSWGDSPAAEVHVGGANIDQPGWLRARRDTLPQDLLLHEEPQLPSLGGAMLARAAVTGEDLHAAYDRLHGEILSVPAGTEAASVDARYGAYRREVDAAVAEVR